MLGEPDSVDPNKTTYVPYSLPWKNRRKAKKNSINLEETG
jgi:hypothetical protein